VFPSPSVALTDSQTVVPNIVGLASEKAFGALMASYLSARVTQQASDTVAADLVVSVSPSPGTIIDKGSQVMVVVSAGPVAESSST
jgi:serine/threonine-protein kinase